jgi:hypothetical protein
MKQPKNIQKMLRQQLNEQTNLPKYSAVVLDKESHDKLINELKNQIPQGWKIYAHHMTIAFKQPLEDKSQLGKTVTLRATKLGISDMAMAVMVDGYPSKNKIPHVTIAVNPNGGKPFMSNQIENWQTINPITLVGQVTEVF